MRKNIWRGLTALMLALVLVGLLPMQAQAASSVSFTSVSDGFNMTITNLTADGSEISYFNGYNKQLVVTNKSSAANPGGYTFSYYVKLENASNQKQFVNLTVGNKYTGSFVWTDCTQPLSVTQTHERNSQVDTHPNGEPITGRYTWKAAFTRGAYASHDLITVTTKEATCSAAGEQKVICSRCAYVQSTTTLPQNPAAHSYTYTSLGNGKHKAVCAHNAAHTISEETCSGGTATCTAKAMCQKCRSLYGQTLSHSWTEWKPGTGTIFAHYRSCTACNPSGAIGSTGYEAELSHTFEGASCVQKGRCKCGAEDRYGDHTYTYTKDGDTIRAVCSTSSEHDAIISLVQDDTVSTVYTGSSIEALKVQSSGYQQISAPISYTDNVNVGTAKGSITLGGATIEKTFEINRATMTAEQLPKNYTGIYDGQAHGIDTASLPAGSKVEYKDSEAGEYSATAVTRTDAGTTKVWYKVTHPNYQELTGTADIIIEAASLEGAVITLTQDSFVYNGQVQKPGISVTLEGLGTLTEGTDYVTGYSAPMKIENGEPVKWFGGIGDDHSEADAGTYYAIIWGKEGGNFKVGSKLGFYKAYTIEKAEPDVTAPVAKTGLVYNGQGHALAEAGSTALGTMHYSLEENGTYGASIPEGVEAGDYTVWYRAEVAAEERNYKTSQPKSIEVTISKAEPIYTEPKAVTGLSYDGTAKELVTAGESEHGTFQYRLSESDEWSDDIPTAVDGGSYTVYWKLVGDKNHKDKEGSVSATIGRSDVKLTAADFVYTAPENLVYSASAKAAKVEVKDKTGVGAITVKYDKDPVNVGAYKVTIDVAAGTNYEAATGLTSDDWTFTIEKAQPAISWEKTEFTYNGEKQGQAKVTLVGGETYSGTVNYSYGISADSGVRGLPTNAGTYVVRASIEAQGNYNAAYNQETIVIKVKEVTPTATLSAETYTHDGNEKKPAVKVYDGETEIPAAEYTVSYANNTAVGAATVTITDKPDGNYSFAAFNKVFVILPDTSGLDGVTTENVNSDDQKAIDDIQKAMEVGIPGASDAAKDAWDDLAEHCKDLEKAISDAATTADKIEEDTAALTAPKTSDLEKIGDLLEQYEDIEGNLTDAEKDALEEEIETLTEHKEAIEAAKDDLKAVTDTAALKAEEADFEDKAKIKDALETAEDLEDNTYLTDAEKSALETAVGKLEDLEEEYAAAEKVEKDHLNKLTDPKPGTKESIEAYEAAKKAYEDLGADKSKVDPKAVKKLTDFLEDLTDYKITKGSGAKWVKNSSSGLSFTANGYYPHFKGVKVDGKFLSDSKYTSKAGSTIVTLNKEYLKTLKNGTHTIAIVYNDGDYEGEATGTFKVTAAATTPATGDNILIPFALLLLSVTGLAALAVLKKRRA